MTLGPEAQFLEFLKSGKFMLQRMSDTGEHVFYPRHIAQSREWTWVEASGQGAVYSRTIIRRKPERGGNFCVALVELEEGPRVLGRVITTDPENVSIGMPLEASVSAVDWWKDTPVIAFYPKERKIRHA
ncbi:hypothetical protein BW45_19495 [Agrobacterium tumefaciens]|nr:hypothetical protein BW45_19495 [Agrobacterium tumefaciens]